VGRWDDAMSPNGIDLQPNPWGILQKSGAGDLSIATHLSRGTRERSAGVSRRGSLHAELPTEPAEASQSDSQRTARILVALIHAGYPNNGVLIKAAIHASPPLNYQVGYE
jgi:hypothetical protein